MKIKGVQLHHLIGSIFLGAGLGLGAFSFILTNNILHSSFKAYVITSGSMQPAIKAGSVIISKSQENYKNGDVISFKPDDKKSDVVTHRIIAIENGLFLTKGDANEEADTWKISQDQIIGKANITIPNLGFIVDFAKTPKGFVILVIIPATIIIYEEVKNLGKEIRKLILRSKQKSTSLSILLALIFPTLIIGTYLISTSNAIFFDFETSRMDVLSATATYSPSPTPSVSGLGVVINEVYYFVCTPANTCGNNPGNEWIELYNNNSTAVSIDDWTITDNQETDIIPAGTVIQANSFAIITKEQHTFDIWSSIPLSMQVLLGENIGNGLNDNGDRIILKNNLGQEIDQISYENDTFVFNPSIPGVDRGHSIERASLGVDSDSKDDFIDKTTPSPGS